jgi:hypothetical protein
VVGEKAAVRELAPRGRVVVMHTAVPALTMTGLHPSVVEPYWKVIVPAAEGASVAVRVRLAP